jgi:SAM-dependent methyltransferase
MNGLRRWYDVRLYAVFYDPLERARREAIAAYIGHGSAVLDEACGTGALAFHLAEKCSRVTGVELSLKMVRHARARLAKTGKTKVFIGGPSSYKIYKTYIEDGGLDGLLARAGLLADAETQDHSGAWRVLRAPVAGGAGKSP